MVYETEECTLYPYILKGFNQERVLYFVKCFFCIYWENHTIFAFFLVDMIYHADQFENVELHLHPRDESHLVMMDNPFNVQLDAIS